MRVCYFCDCCEVEYVVLQWYKGDRTVLTDCIYLWGEFLHWSHITYCISSCFRHRLIPDGLLLTVGYIEYWLVILQLAFQRDAILAKSWLLALTILESSARELCR